MTARPDEVVAWMYVYVDADGSEEFEFNTGRGCSGYANEFGATETPLVKLSSLQSANARLDAVLALADELSAKADEHRGYGYDDCNSVVYFSEVHAEAIRRAAAGEGDAPPIEIDTPTVASGEL